MQNRETHGRGTTSGVWGRGRHKTSVPETAEGRTLTGTIDQSRHLTDQVGWAFASATSGPGRDDAAPILQRIGRRGRVCYFAPAERRRVAATAALAHGQRELSKSRCRRQRRRRGYLRRERSTGEGVRRRDKAGPGKSVGRRRGWRHRLRRTVLVGIRPIGPPGTSTTRSPGTAEHRFADGIYARPEDTESQATTDHPPPTRRWFCNTTDPGDPDVLHVGHEWRRSEGRRLRHLRHLFRAQYSYDDRPAQGVVDGERRLRRHDYDAAAMARAERRAATRRPNCTRRGYTFPNCLTERSTRGGTTRWRCATARSAAPRQTRPGRRNTPTAPKGRSRHPDQTDSRLSTLKDQCADVGRRRRHHAVRAARTAVGRLRAGADA